MSESRSTSRNLKEQDDPKKERAAEEAFDFGFRESDLKDRLAKFRAGLSNEDTSALQRQLADGFELTNEWDESHVKQVDTIRFLEISEELARLNPPVTTEQAMQRLVKSFEQGEFDRDGHSKVYVRGEPWGRDAHERAMAVPQNRRETGPYPSVYRIPKPILTDWARHWEFRLPPVLKAPEQRSIDPAPGDQAKPSPPKRTAGAKQSKRDATKAYLQGAYPNGIPPAVKNDALVGELAAANIHVSEKTLRRALIDIGQNPDK
jgi:hypothetical protein